MANHRPNPLGTETHTLGDRATELEKEAGEFIYLKRASAWWEIVSPGNEGENNTHTHTHETKTNT